MAWDQHREPDAAGHQPSAGEKSWPEAATGGAPPTPASEEISSTLGIQMSRRNVLDSKQVGA